MVWTGNQNILNIETDQQIELIIENKSNTIHIKLPKKQGFWLSDLLRKTHTSNTKLLAYKEIEADFNTSELGYFLLFWNENAITQLRQNGLLIL